MLARTLEPTDATRPCSDPDPALMLMLNMTLTLS